MAWFTEKSNSDTYVMRWRGEPHHRWWAVIFVNSEYNCLSIQSDFGDYSHRWGNPGDSFKEFLARVNDSYLIDKLSYGNKDNLYEEESMKALKTFVEEMKKEHPDREDELDEALETIQGHGPRSADAMSILVMQSTIGELIQDYEAYGEFVKTGPSHQLLAFVKEIWPGFKEVLKKELESAPK